MRSHDDIEIDKSSALRGGGTVGRGRGDVDHSCLRTGGYLHVRRAGVELIRPGVGGGHERGEVAGEMAQKVCVLKKKKERKGFL